MDKTALLKRVGKN